MGPLMPHARVPAPYLYATMPTQSLGHENRRIYSPSTFAAISFVPQIRHTYNIYVYLIYIIHIYF